MWNVRLVVRNNKTRAPAPGTLVWSGAQPRALIEEVLREAPAKLEARVNALARQQRVAAAPRRRSSSTARRQVLPAAAGDTGGGGRQSLDATPTRRPTPTPRRRWHGLSTGASHTRAALRRTRARCSRSRWAPAPSAAR